MAANNYTKYDEDFKKSLVSLHQNGKTQTQLCKEYGVSQSALGKWIKQYSTVEIDDGQVLTAKQVKELQKRNAQLEEENLILKKARVCFGFCVKSKQGYNRCWQGGLSPCFSI